MADAQRPPRPLDVSVVIPLYNGAPWIEDTIDAVQAQTHSPREIVVVDDGSDDGSPALVRSSFPDVTLLRTPGDGGDGAGQARSLGLQHTSSPLVAFLDQDDLWHPSHLRILTRLLDDNSHPAALAGLDHFRDSEAPHYDLQSDGVEHFSPWEHYPQNTIHSPSCVLIRRSALERIGGWPTQFTISDMNAWFKLTTEAPMLQSEKVSVGKRVHGESFLEQLRTEEALSFLQAHIRACEDALAFRKTVGAEREEDFQDRLEALKGIEGALEGVTRGDMQMLKEAALSLDRECSLDPERAKALWFFGLRLFSMPKSQIPAVDVSRQRMVLGRMIRGWPNQCRRIRSPLARALTQTISYSAFLLYLVQAPLSAGTSLLFYECLKIEVNKALEAGKRRVRASMDGVGRFVSEWMHLSTSTAD